MRVILEISALQICIRCLKVPLTSGASKIMNFILAHSVLFLSYLRTMLTIFWKSSRLVQSSPSSAIFGSLAFHSSGA